MEKRTLYRALALGCLLALATPPAALADPPPEPYCTGGYADDLGALARAARELEQKQAPYTYCVRSTAVYECPSYAADGSLRKTRRKVTSHGTAFGLRVENGETLMVTNEHVSEWPAVTADDRSVEEVPAGCRRVSGVVKIVDDESDAYERDDVALSRVLADKQLDVSIVRAKGVYPVMPWKIGRSADLRERNVVDVRGFPLGVLRANNVGKVISTDRRDEDNGWEHDDFVIDALLSPGSSGSPVFAVSCATGEFELVGLYHARYTKGSALHTVVGIDQVREMLATLQRAPRPEAQASAAGAGRERIALAARAAVEPYFPFGGLTAAVRPGPGGALLFELMSRDFPLQAHPALVLEDAPAAEGPGRLGRVWAGNRQGLLEAEPAALDGDARALLSKLLDALRRDAQLAFDYRDVAPAAAASRERFNEARRLERALKRSASSRGDLAQAALDLGEQLCPRFADAPVSLADLVERPAPPPAWAPPFPASPPGPLRAAPVPVASPRLGSGGGS